MGVNLGKTSLNDRLNDSARKGPAEWHRATVTDTNGVVLFETDMLCPAQFANLLKEVAEEGVRLKMSHKIEAYEEL